jgi:osmoprotectant transport system permease protein
MTYLIAHAGRVAGLANEHLALVAAALALAFAIAFPLGALAAKRSKLEAALLGTLGALYTVPSLALLALLVRAFGLGPAPVFAALVAYAQFAIVRGVIAGLRGVDPAALDAATGLGMTPLQRLIRIEVPLAAPVIIGGVRVAAVAMVAIAMLGGYVGAGGLGTLIFTGLAIHHTDEIAAGSIAACGLAVAIDLSLRAFERACTR